MRQVTFDSETTGLDPIQGDRLVEVAAVEMIDGLRTGKTFHTIINPMRAIGAEVTQIHGITNADVIGKPVFGDIAAALFEFLGTGDVIIHNAPFDFKFLKYELTLIKMEHLLDNIHIIDTLEMARQKFPGSPIGLDALCRRFGVSLTDRTLHGALIDSSLLAEVYLNLTGGRQRTFDLLSMTGAATAPVASTTSSGPRPLRAFVPSPELVANHTAFLARTFSKKDAATGAMIDSSQWTKLASAETPSS